MTHVTGAQRFLPRGFGIGGADGFPWGGGWINAPFRSSVAAGGRTVCRPRALPVLPSSVCDETSPARFVLGQHFAERGLWLPRTGSGSRLSADGGGPTS